MNKEESTFDMKYTKWQTYKRVNGKVVTEIVESQPMTIDKALKKFKCGAIQAIID